MTEWRVGSGDLIEGRLVLVVQDIFVSHLTGLFGWTWQVQGWPHGIYPQSRAAGLVGGRGSKVTHPVNHCGELYNPTRTLSSRPSSAATSSLRHPDCWDHRWPFSYLRRARPAFAVAYPSFVEIHLRNHTRHHAIHPRLPRFHNHPTHHFATLPAFPPRLPPALHHYRIRLPRWPVGGVLPRHAWVCVLPAWVFENDVKGED